MERDLRTVQEIYAACTRRDFKTALLPLSQEIEIVQSPELPWGGLHIGPEAANQFFAAQSEHFDARLLVEQLIDAGDQVVAVGRSQGQSRHTRLEFDLPVVHIWTFRNGQVVRFEAFTDNATLLAALGK